MDTCIRVNLHLSLSLSALFLGWLGSDQEPPNICARVADPVVKKNRIQPHKMHPHFPFL